MNRSSQGRPWVLDAAFFARPADRVARDLLGARLAVRRPDGGVERHIVFETEAYLGAHDLACHGARGMTARTAVMFGPAGRTPRIGVGYAGAWAEKPLRYVVDPAEFPIIEASAAGG